MNIYLKLIFACVLGGLFSISVKKHSPEIAVVIGVSMIISCMMATAVLISLIKQQFQSLELLSYLPQNIFLPLIKCIAVSLITQLACGLCKDTGQSAAAYGLEFTGCVVLILCIMPLLEMLFQFIEGIL